MGEIQNSVNSILNTAAAGAFAVNKALGDSPVFKENVDSLKDSIERNYTASEKNLVESQEYGAKASEAQDVIDNIQQENLSPENKLMSMIFPEEYESLKTNVESKYGAKRSDAEMAQTAYEEVSKKQATKAELLEKRLQHSNSIAGKININRKRDSTSLLSDLSLNSPRGKYISISQPFKGDK